GIVVDDQYNGVSGGWRASAHLVACCVAGAIIRTRTALFFIVVETRSKVTGGTFRLERRDVDRHRCLKNGHILSSGISGLGVHLRGLRRVARVKKTGENDGRAAAQ